MNAQLDENTRQTLTAISSVDNKTVISLWADPTTHRLLVDATGAFSVSTNATLTGDGTVGDPLSVADIYVLRAGDTMTGALIADDHESTGLVAQVSNTMWGAIGDRPATAPIGTKYYVLP
jgi:hypothetical protein